MNNDEMNKFIEEGLAEIDKEVRDDESIREQSKDITRQLILYGKGKPSIVQGLPNGNWQLVYDTFVYDNPKTKQRETSVRLMCLNELRFQMAGLGYRPLTIDALIDEDYDEEQALLAAVTAFVAKQYDKFIVEQLDD